MMDRFGKYLIIRELTSSDMGWFAAPRDSGRIASKQRAINFNAAIISKLLPKTVLEAGEIYLDAVCQRPEAHDRQIRILSKVHKNWRLGGKKAPGDVFMQLREGDFFICLLEIFEKSPYLMAWTVVFQEELKKFKKIIESLSFQDRMVLMNDNDPIAIDIKNELKLSCPIRQHVVEDEIISTGRTNRKKLTVRERLQQPHILEEMLKVSLSLSSEAQSDFLIVLENIASGFRDILLNEGKIRSIEISHRNLWDEVEGRPVAFVDGGSANLASLGSEPVAIRVGSYVVTPGKNDGLREVFKIEKQLVDELFDVTERMGVYEDIFEDVAKLRDVARISLEAAGAVNTIQASLAPDFLFLHGTLVNPVSAYALEGFPDFTERGLKLLLPDSEHHRTERYRNFVSTYLKQLEILRDSETTVCGVVERASGSRIVTGTLVEMLKKLENSPGSSILEQTMQKIIDYRISDAVLFHCMLNEGEYLEPVEIDRNDMRRAPNSWKDIIQEYPRPLVTYVGVGEVSLPVRVEFFNEPNDGYDLVMRLIVHSCRLMPNYAFPAGLDIVDKFAKVPDWMSRPISNVMATQFLRKAMASGDPRVITEAKRLLSGNSRDWFFRPRFDR